MASDYDVQFLAERHSMGWDNLDQTADQLMVLKEVQWRYPSLVFGFEADTNNAGKFRVKVVTDSSTTKLAKSATYDGASGGDGDPNARPYDYTGAQRDNGAKSDGASGKVQQSEYSHMTPWNQPGV